MSCFQRTRLATAELRTSSSLKSVSKRRQNVQVFGDVRTREEAVAYDDQWTDYGGTSLYRGSGAARAAKLGAVAALVRSTAGASLYTAHTGSQRDSDGVPRIPAAAITVEDAAWIRRLVESGQSVKVCLKMEAQTLPDANSANVMGEIVGRELPDEVVVVGGHIDSWDGGRERMTMPAV